MKKWLVSALAVSGLCVASLVNAADIAGKWKTVDDKTGYVRAIIEITKQPDGSFNGVVKEKFALPDAPPNDYCKKCPAPFTNKPIVGLQILNHLVEYSNKPNNYSDGTLLDPLSGKTYKAKARMTSDGSKLFLRGYVGVSAIGRSQVWLRAK